jgi:hypothetical protein
MDPIATLELVELTPGGERRAIRVEVGRPRIDPGGSWVCPVLITAIDAKVRDIHGADSMQALCLALGFAHRILQSVLDRGSRLVDGSEEEGDFPLAAYFGNKACTLGPGRGR